MSSRLLLSVLIVAVFTIAGFASSKAWATPEYPGVIRSTYSVKLTQDCSLCHRNGQQVSSAVTTPFALTMKARGLVKYSVPSLRAALSRVEDAGTDSDFDGVGDIDELRAETDPNLGPDGNPGLSPPRYGCGASVVPAMMSALALLVLARVRSSRRA